MGTELGEPSNRRHAVPWRALGLVLALVLVAAATCGLLSRSVAPEPPKKRVVAKGPNIILILDDDERWDTLWAMPNVRKLLVAHGVKFADAFVSNPLCCPSRTTILTGRYSMSTGVWQNIGVHGGFQSFHSDSSTVATWLHAAGYRTALIGKYMNGYEGHLNYVPPGWDRWFALEKVRYYGYLVSDDGHPRHFGRAPQDYSTTVLQRTAVQFIQSTPSKQPFFLYFAPIGPHVPSTPAPRDIGSFSSLPSWRPPSYAEPDASGKPQYIQQERWTAHKREQTDAFRKLAYESLRSVDRSVKAIVEELRATDRLSNTMIVFMSDNGLLWGEHRLFSKSAPYEESIRVPMILRYPPLVPKPRVDRHLIVNVDLAPTFAQAAGTTAPGAQGQSLFGLLNGTNTHWRTYFPIVHYDDPSGPGDVPTYCGVRTTTEMYARYQNGDEELYNLRADPSELTNLASGDPAEVARLRALTRKLCSPPPPGYSWP